MVENLTTENFKNKIFDFENKKEWVYIGSKPSIIKFGAEWCQPCKTIDPILNELSEEYTGKLNIYKIDIENEPKLAKAFSIKSIPTILFIPMNGQPQIMIGGLPKEKFKKGITDILQIT